MSIQNIQWIVFMVWQFCNVYWVLVIGVFVMYGMGNY